MVRKIVCGLLAMFFGVGIVVNAQKIPSVRPKLLVMMLFDELSTEQLVAFRSNFGDNGFNRLINGGAFYRNSALPSGSSYDGTSLTGLYTGAYATTHGIVSDWWYDRLRKKEVSAAYGDLLIETENTRYPSADRLLSSTFTDELKMMYNGASKVTAVAMNPDNLVWAGGKRSDFLFDINLSSGQLNTLTDSIEREEPEWVKDFNKKKLLELYSKRQWGPSKDIARYHEMMYYSDRRASSNPFMYDLAKTDDQKDYVKALYSPYGNKLLRDFSVSTLINQELGKDEVPDVLTVQFTTKNVHGERNDAYSAETEDMLLQLDEEIAELLRLIDSEVGLENSLVVATSISAHKYGAENLPNGEKKPVFSGEKAASLLNLYLMALYGQGKWVMAYHDAQLYLNHELIKERQVELAKVREQSAQFLTDMNGVAFAVSVSHLYQMPASTGAINSLKQIYHHKRSGDLFIKLHPGWQEELEDGKVISRSWKAKYVPLIFYGWKIKHHETHRVVPIVDVAPTISSFLEIPFPNGCDGTPMKGLINQD